MYPGGTHRRRHRAPQVLLARHLGTVALFPGGKQLGQCFAMGLCGQLAQGQFCTFKGIALGTEGHITQARATVFKLGTGTKTATALTRRTKALAVAPCRAGAIATHAITTRATAAVFAVTKLTPPASRGRRASAACAATASCAAP